eukprot:TRINITY_DN4046_c0_g1_i1.p1 TRINITY_DN4046_c0_g1~~TRINITY_DN4046_c0_g1_i1.p1  ORF type:complete len:283 (-),score=64.57 TRINITY_DN4046_c0_g1_i1:122-970(-)
MSTLTLLSETKCFGGFLRRYSHDSLIVGCVMRFHVFVPPQASLKLCPSLFFLSGLTCTDENFVQKAGAQRAAATHGLFLIAPDTSPRGLNIEGEDASWDFGLGAGFYVNATQEKWKNYRMYEYVTVELLNIIHSNFNVDKDRQSIMGHSMGGHGALVIGIRNPAVFKSISAFAPIVHPCAVPWGIKAFSGYLGEENKEAWKEYDATHLIEKYSGPELKIMIDQGTADKFLDGQLQTHHFSVACEKKSFPIICRMQDGYDHSYFFISTFVDEHIAFHASHLNA